MDPLAELMSNYRPYVYTFNNPVNLTDPTGMAPEEKDDWVEYTGHRGNTQYIYDSDIKTKEQAIAKGYYNVKNVSREMVIGSGDDIYKLSDKARVTNLSTGTEVKPGFMMNDGNYVGENNMFKATTSGLQDGGDAMAYAGYGLTLSGVGAKVGVPLAAIGNGISTLGSALGVIGSFVENQGDYKSAGFVVGGALA